MRVQGEFKVMKWDETELGGFPEDMPIARASITFAVSGEINGVLNVEYLLQYTNQDKDNSQASYTGYMCFLGDIKGESGSFIVEDKGAYTPEGPVSQFTIKPGTGTGDLAHAAGTGHYGMQDGKMVLTFDLL